MKWETDDDDGDAGNDPVDVVELTICKLRGTLIPSGGLAFGLTLFSG